MVIIKYMNVINVVSFLSLYTRVVVIVSIEIKCTHISYCFEKLMYVAK